MGTRIVSVTWVPRGAPASNDGRDRRVQHRGVGSDTGANDEEVVALAVMMQCALAVSDEL
jgi:hypothetical protein